jgi:hypothetical protein
MARYVKLLHSYLPRIRIPTAPPSRFTRKDLPPSWCPNELGGRCSIWRSLVFSIFIIFIIIFLGGCMTDATVDLTKAPFDASTALTDATTGAATKLTDGTSQATTDLTEPTREFLSSTTPGAWFHTDGTLRRDHETVAFVVLNFDNLQENFAQGEGEYLASLAKLTGITPTDSDQFMKFVQRRYAYIFENRHSRPESLRRLLRTLQRSSFPS